MEETSDETITNSIGMKLTLIPAGGFMMGSPDSDEMASSHEKPQHHVEITQPFYLGVYPVTQAEYERVMGSNPSHYKGNDRRPVDKVNWFDTVAFCNKLSEIEKLRPFYKFSGVNVTKVTIVGGRGYRLPTEAEWEYACRAGTTTKWNCGNIESQLEQYVWGRNSCSRCPVGEKKPNNWGLYDTYGTVYEWCWDWYDDYHSEYYYRKSPANDPKGPLAGTCRVLRGSLYYIYSSGKRSADRGCYLPDFSNDNIGFRLARTLPLVPAAVLPK